MDIISTKAISIAVSVFVTIAIVSGVFYVINQMKVIYEEVYETDISIQSMFSQFDEYENTQKSGIEVLNATKKYLNNPIINVYIGNTLLDSSSAFYTSYTAKIGQNDYTDYLSKIGEDKYKSQVLLDETTGITSIIFTKI